MYIAYRHNPRHLDVCERFVQEHKAEILAGETIGMTWPERAPGYSGRIIVRIVRDNHQELWSEQEFSDTSRFPARIRAMAKALWTQACYGRFEIYHEAGDLTVRALRTS